MSNLGIEANRHRHILHPAGDKTAARLREEYGLYAHTTLADIESVAEELLKHPSTARDAAILVWNRAIPHTEGLVETIIQLPGSDVREKLKLLLNERLDKASLE